MTCPCKDCEARTLNCHDRCGQFGEWKNSLPKKQPELARDLLWDGIKKAVRKKNRKSKLRNYGGEQ